VFALPLLAVLAPGTPVPAEPVKAFILAGQSNMEGHGVVAADPNRNGGQGSLAWLARDPKARREFGKLIARDGTWRVRNDVNIHYLDRKGPLTVGYGVNADRIGPELGFGNVVGDAIREPVVLIKLAWGGKSLAQDFRPPNAGPTSEGKSPGAFYAEVVNRSRAVLANVGDEFPSLKGRPVELVGFGWHQGWNDRVNGAFVDEYERNMAHFIRDIRRDLNAPHLPFVIAETGMGGAAESNARALKLMTAQASVARRYEFRGTVAFVGTRSFWRTADQSPNDQGYHWNGNAETYYRIGDAMGRAMLELIEGGAK